MTFTLPARAFSRATISSAVQEVSGFSSPLSDASLASARPTPGVSTNGMHTGLSRLTARPKMSVWKIWRRSHPSRPPG